MPERFIGAATSYREPKRPAAPSAPAGAPAVPAAAKKPPLLLFVIVGVVILGAFGVGGWLLLRPKPKPAPAPAVNRPIPTNRNINRPTNANVPTNVNANVNANVPANVNAPTNVNANLPVVPPPPLRSSTDSDVDGLTDAEERLYGTGLTRPDSDGDGFLDGNEVFHLYNPAALAPTTLRDSGLVRIHEDAVRGYEILYPSAWTRRVLDETTGTTTFTASSGEFIQVLSENNPAGLEIAEWYLSRSPGVSRTELESIATKGGYAAVRSPDRLTTYIASGSRVFIIPYNIGNLPEVSFRQTYEMMVNSFRVTVAAPITPAPGSTPTSTATSTP